MPHYKVSISKTAAKQLDKLSDSIVEPIISAIEVWKKICDRTAAKNSKDGMLTKSVLKIIV